MPKPETVDKETGEIDTPKPPEGMTQSDTDLDNQKKHDFDKNPLLIGKILKIKEFKEVKGERTRMVKFAIVETENEVVQLWESANLETFFSDIKVGFEVWVLFKHIIPLKGAKTMRMFDAFYTEA